MLKSDEHSPAHVFLPLRFCREVVVFWQLLGATRRLNYKLLACNFEPVEVARKTNSSKTETTNANWRRGEAGNGSDVEVVVGGGVKAVCRVVAEREEGRARTREERERERQVKRAKTLFSN